MNYKWILCAVLPVFLVSCGGGTKNDGLSGREPGYAFLVNTKENVDYVEVTEYTRTRDNYSAKLELCEYNSEPLYDNYTEITQSGQDEYCDGEQQFTSPEIVFQVKFINSTYDNYPLTYTGVGFTIKIYDAGNNEIWNSDAAQYQVNKFYGDVDYDPQQTTSIVLGPQTTFPSVSYRTFEFFAASNFSNVDGDDFRPADYGEQQLNLLHFSDGLCALQLTDTNSNGVADKPPCQPVYLGAGTYTAVVSFNFNGSTETRNITINVLPQT